MAKSDLRIDILGTSITISTDEKPEYLDMLLSKYRAAVENIQRASGLKDPLKVAILTGFLLCDDLQKAGTAVAVEKEPGELEQLTLGMISRLDEALKEPLASDAPEMVSDTLPVEAEAEIEAKAEAEACAPAPSVPKALPALFKLQNTVKNYEWGSPEWIPTLLGQRNLSRVPWAELWMGVHPAGPSRVVVPDQAGPLLSELIGSDPEAFLGEDAAKAFGKKLPFLFKVEAVARPLSIQAHPNKEQAQEGFRRENEEGIPLDAANRNYRDSNHKPEILCALSSTFAALCGFRDAQKIASLLGILQSSCEGPLKGDLERLLSALEQREENPLKAFLAALFSLGEEARKDAGLFIKNNQLLLERDFPEYKDEWALCAYLSSLYPGDTGAIAPLYLNIIELAPGEAIYLPSGVPHAYIHGMGIELMADSDNVLRGGLTPKHVDVDELFSILDFSEYRPEIIRVPEPVPARFTYPAPAEEFALSMMRGWGGDISYAEKAASIVMVTKGSATVTPREGGAGITLNAGESVFIPAGEKAGMVFSGTFTAYAAATPPGIPQAADR